MKQNNCLIKLLGVGATIKQSCGDKWMTVYVFALLVLSIICIFLAIQIRNNQNKLKMKIESGEIINAKVISWKVITGRPTFYVMKVAYEIDNIKKNKTFITSGKSARKYELDRDIQIIIIPNSNKVFLEEENWKVQNICNFVLLIFAALLLLQLLVIGFVEIFI